MSAGKVAVLAIMVDRFLSWRLPDDFAPDAGISFNPGPTQHMPHCWPVGTNLLTATQARAMIKHLIGDELDELVAAASAGTDEQQDRAVSPGLWFGPNRAERLRNALARIGAK